jgi:DinB superfamily
VQSIQYGLDQYLRKGASTIKLIDSLRTEFDNEAQTARKHLERLSDNKFDWRPHPKSFTAGALASHIVDSIGFADPIFNLDELDIDPATFKPYRAGSSGELLKAFDERLPVAGNCSKGRTTRT